VVDSDRESLSTLIDQMVDVMYTNEGVGLAAPQIGRNVRLVLIDPSAGENDKALRVMINPIVLKQSAEVDVRPEGCLSLPGSIFNVKRSLGVKVKYLDPAFKQVEADLHDMEARIFLHELDHLSGILISDIGTRATFRPREDR